MVSIVSEMKSRLWNPSVKAPLDLPHDFLSKFISYISYPPALLNYPGLINSSPSMVSKFPSLGLSCAISMTLVCTVIYSLACPSQTSPLMATLSKIPILVILYHLFPLSLSSQHYLLNSVPCICLFAYFHCYCYNVSVMMAGTSSASIVIVNPSSLKCARHIKNVQ